jgi:drug/metabolite transporter (DMT)-like permease
MIRLASGLTPTVILLILSTILLLAGGQVLFKQAAGALSFSKPLSLLSWQLLLALTVYGVATLLWLVVLSRVPLSVAFPFYGLTFLLVPTFAWLLLKEPIRPQVLIGGAVIMVGVVISSFNGRP